MKKSYLLFIFAIYTIDSLSQDNIIYHLKNPIKIKGQNFSCFEHQNDTVNCSNKHLKEGKWMYYTGLSGLNLDSTQKNRYSYAESFRFILSEGEFINNKKEGVWTIYSKPIWENGYDLHDQHIERIIKYKNGIKDSVEIVYYPNIDYEIKLYWNNSTKERIEIFYRNTIVLDAYFFDSNRLKKFDFYEQGSLKYKWSYKPESKTNNIILINKDGSESTTFKETIFDILPLVYFETFMYAI